MKNNKGLTLIELVVVMALLFIILPFGWDYLNSGLKDSATVNNKIMVQNSVNALMNQVQRDIQEARCPINPNTTKYVNVIGDGFLICKPTTMDDEGHDVYQSVLYKFEGNKVTAEFGKKLQFPNPTNGETEHTIVPGITGNVGVYDFIEEFRLDLTADRKGIEVYIKGKIDDKSSYVLTNTYYTRNTVF